MTTEQEKRYNVFVYGTLKMAERNNAVIKRPGNKYICDDYITGYAIYDMPYGFPFVIYTGNKEDIVYGETWEINHATLDGMDALEGYREDRVLNHYERVTVKAYSDLECFVYVYENFPKCNYVRCEDGVWNYVVNNMNYMEE